MPDTPFRPEANGRNRLQELFQHIGQPTHGNLLVSTVRVGEQEFQATALATLPSGETFEGTGPVSHGKSHTESAACDDALGKITAHHPDLLHPWEERRIAAQCGDLLIKLAVFAGQPRDSAEIGAWRLQQVEQNEQLARLFDVWRTTDPALARWGPALAVERKATLVEARIWELWRERVLRPDFEEALRELLAAVSADAEPPHRTTP